MRTTDQSTEQGGEHLAPSDPAQAGLLESAANDLPDATPTKPSEAQLLRIQAVHGNQFAQRFVQRAISGAPVQRLPEDEIAARLSSTGGGSSLEPGVRGRLEAGLGADLGDVRVHTDAESDEMARSVNALAFTTGRDIYFQEGTYSPGSPQGDRLIAHEVVHTIQQSAVDTGSEAASAAVQRQDDSGAGAPATSDGSPEGGQDVTAKLRAILDSLQNLYSQTKANFTPDQADAAAGDATVGQHFEAVESAIAQITAAISSNDEMLRASILAAFTPATITAATSQAGASIPIDARSAGADNGSGAASPVVQRLARSFAPKSLDISRPQDPAEIEADVIAEQLLSGGGIATGRVESAESQGSVQRMAAWALPLIGFEVGGGAEVEAAAGPAGWAVAAVVGLAILVAVAVPSDDATPDDTTSEMANAVDGKTASSQLGNIAQHLARLLRLTSVGGMPPDEEPPNNDDPDKHWWTEIKAFVKDFLQAVKGASRKQIMRELLKRGWTEDEIAEIIAKLAEAAKKMGDDPPDLIPPP